MAKPARRIGNLPAEATSFVGRRHELAELRKKLASARLVSLIGPGGVGKSRLALRAATDLSRGFPAGAWWVELAEVRVPGLVANAVLAALDLRDQAGTEPLVLLLAHLRERHLLLVLDNCEHLLEVSAAFATEVLRAAPGVRVIATSREPLSAPGEHVLPVPPLDLPSTDSAEPLHRLRQNEAVTLFVERAGAASGAFELTEANRRAVADLCRRLDGLPLAIELAAVRTRILTVEQILERLSDRFGLLTGAGRAALPRHKTLETAIDWSFEMLSAREQALLRRLCVFAGRFTLEDVEGVCTSDEVPAGNGLELLSSLVDKSLVIKEDARGVACHRLHETMREYAARKLVDAHEHRELQERCTVYYLSAAQRMSPQARFRLPEWLAWMDLEIDNIRPVLRRCLVESDSVRGIQLATSLAWFWITRGTTEGVRWLDELLASGPGNPETLGWSYFIRGFLAVLQGNWEAARPALEKSMTAARDAGQPVQLANALSMASIAAAMAGDRPSAQSFLDLAHDLAAELDDVPAKVAVLQGNWEAARPALEKSMAAARDAGQPVQLANALSMASIAAAMAGDRPSAQSFLDLAHDLAAELDDVPAKVGVLQARALNALYGGDFETLKLVSTEGARMSREVGDLYALHMMNLNLGGAALLAGDLEESKARYQESLRIAYRIDDRIGQYYLLGALGLHAAIAGQPKTAAQLLGASEKIRIGAGATVMPAMSPIINQARETAAAALGASRFEAELETGMRLSRDTAVSMALGEPVHPGGEETSGVGVGLLAKREAEVARLVAEGLSNKQIGARLFISERTVDSHVRSILNKLGFNSRAQIAGWVSSVPSR
ncbi:MAG: LuxR family transcriptional regulator [Chloroflexi bacterium]|nr:MAG: LuxR family transcriptional regulator [Chloroflexota bacterium]